MGIEGYLTAAQVAERLGAGVRTVARWCAEGRLPGARKIGAARGAWYIPEAALQGFERPKPGPKPRRAK